LKIDFDHGRTSYFEKYLEVQHQLKVKSIHNI